MVPAFDPTREYALHREEYLEAFDRVLSSGSLVLGPETESFEHEFAEYVGARLAVGVNSGTDALILALLALGIDVGDEVIIPALTAPATAAAVRSVGAMPRFVDVSPQTLTMDPSSVERQITINTRCLIPVHLHGCPAAMDSLTDIAARHGLALIEDCAQAHGTTFDGRHVGTFGSIGCFSFYPTKNLGAFGDGGMCVTNDQQIAQRLRRLRCYGLDQRRIAQIDGRNSRLDELQAALLRLKLSRLDDAIGRRREIAARYRRSLVELPITLPGVDAGHAYHQFVVRAENRGALLRELQERRVQYGLHYMTPLHLMPAYEILCHLRGDLPIAEEAAEQVVSLPCFPELRDDEIDVVADALRDHLTMHKAARA